MKEEISNRTAEEKKLNELFKTATENISKINIEINKLEKDKGNTPRPSPFGNTSPVSQRVAMVNGLKKYKYEYENSIRETYTKDIKDSGKNPTEVMVTKIKEWNEDTSKYPKDVEEIRKENKERDISESQNFAIKIKASNEPRLRFDTIIKDKDGEKLVSTSLINKFNNSLNYTKLKDKQHRDIQKSDKSLTQNKLETFQRNKEDIGDRE